MSKLQNTTQERDVQRPEQFGNQTCSPTCSRGTKLQRANRWATGGGGGQKRSQDFHILKILNEKAKQCHLLSDILPKAH